MTPTHGQVPSLFDVDAPTKAVTHRIREVDAKTTVTQCGLKIPTKDRERFTLTIWARDTTCAECLAHLSNVTLVHHARTTADGFEIDWTEAVPRRTIRY